MEQDSNTPLEVKVCVLGGIAVGKTNIILRFVSNRFDAAPITNICCTVASKSIDIDGKTIKFNVWDTVGMERFRSIVQQYYRGAAAAIVVYDITSKISFEYMKAWVEELLQFEPNAILAVAGNKCDLEEMRKVPREEGRQYAQENNAIFKETSAKTDQNIEDLFIEIGKALPQDLRSCPKTQLLNLSEIKPTQQRPKCCK